jgi:hypothetical protein
VCVCECECVSECVCVCACLRACGSGRKVCEINNLLPKLLPNHNQPCKNEGTRLALFPISSFNPKQQPLLFPCRLCTTIGAPSVMHHNRCIGAPSVMHHNGCPCHTFKVHPPTHPATSNSARDTNVESIKVSCT